MRNRVGVASGVVLVLVALALGWWSLGGSGQEAAAERIDPVPDRASTPAPPPPPSEPDRRSASGRPHRVGPRHPPGSVAADPRPAGPAEGDAPRSSTELVQLGESALDNGDAEAAYASFLKVIESDPDDPLAPFALYKLAWVEYNQGDLDAAIHDIELLSTWLASATDAPSRQLAEGARAALEQFQASADAPEDAP